MVVFVTSDWALNGTDRVIAKYGFVRYLTRYDRIPYRLRRSHFDDVRVLRSQDKSNLIILNGG